MARCVALRRIEAARRDAVREDLLLLVTHGGCVNAAKLVLVRSVEIYDAGMWLGWVATSGLSLIMADCRS